MITIMIASSGLLAGILCGYWFAAYAMRPVHTMLRRHVDELRSARLLLWRCIRELPQGISDKNLDRNLRDFIESKQWSE